MKNYKEFAQEAMRRAEIIKRQNSKRNTKLVCALSALACFLGIVSLPFFLPSVPGDMAEKTVGMAGAAMLADADIGGYVLMGVVGFVLGAAVTFLTVKKVGKD